ncbi:tripartite tricarboxylate transporter substrate binding protein [Roseomonas nepalensis]|uniref:Tripartite tricarboxylate transporter substrate binding protein n=1 Tax=Muricoccus nepalensis TaxID=1854500 RepID=A0A502FWJ3_9PROT|nr:tripartite tricarboxylate transporter substrate-binding protein [Roseomonas nepalensis]TPG53809.1 tripartite tricarboxylate transporter substrate binding protein [Roseomonas nepalensis]
MPRGEGPGRRVLLAAAGAGLVPAAARAQAPAAWPDRPVRLAVAFAPAGPADLVARIVGDRLSQIWGQAAVIENRAGAGGNIGAQLVARARPDGATALVTTSAFAVNPSLTRNAGYRPEELAPAALMASTPNILVVRADSPAADVAALVALARRQPVNFGTAGVGTTPHLSAERLFRLLARVDAQHVPFTGAGPALTAVLGGQLELASVALPAAMEMVRQGGVRGLAVTGARRSAALPEVPTLEERGFPGFDDVTWTAMFFPAATPGAILAKANADVDLALADPETRRRLEAVGFDPMGGSLEAAAAYVANETRRWAEVVRAIGVTLD